MATVIKNYKQLEKAMGQVLKDTIFDTSKVIQEVIDKFLNKWYGDYTPIKYQRTEQFLYDSCVTSKVVKSGNQYKTKIFIDYKNMHHFENTPNGAKPLSKYKEHQIVEYANEGLHGIETSMQGHIPIRFWDDAEEYMNEQNTILNAFCDYLQYLGFEVSLIRDGGISF